MHEQRRAERSAERAAEPPLDEAITPQMLDKAARVHLKSLNKENADLVARHLVAAGQYLETDPELAHQHAVAAQRRAGRIDVVREAVAITAYTTGRYADALREARTVRRLSGDDTLRAIEADSERGLGRPERALAVIAEVELAHQPAHARTELAIVASGARADLGESEAGLLVIEDALRFIRDVELRARLLTVKADRLDELGREAEAEETRALLAAEPAEDSDSVLYIDDALDEELALALELEVAGATEEAPGEAGIAVDGEATTALADEDTPEPGEADTAVDGEATPVPADEDTPVPADEDIPESADEDIPEAADEDIAEPASDDRSEMPVEDSPTPGAPGESDGGEASEEER